MAQAASQAPTLLRLHLVEGPQSGKQLEKKGTSLRVGRTTKSPLYIKDPSISEAHAELVWEGGAWQLRDLGSTNGTSLNGKQLVGEPSEFVALKDGDLIKFGTDTLARVEVAAPPSDEQTVEEFVLQECGQLEQRIRCVRVWASAALRLQAGQAAAAARGRPPLSGDRQLPPADDARRPLHPSNTCCLVPPASPTAAGRGRSRSPTSCGKTGRSRSRRC